MAETSGNGAAPWLAFIVGGLLVLVLAIGYFVYSGGGPSPPSKPVNIEIKAPDLPQGPKLPDAPLPTPK
jgi:hypothetical protein